MSNPYRDISPEVASAIESNQPVVALESIIIAHGMPYPRNVETALRVEDAVREQGAVPATIAIIEGRLKLGLSREQIGYLGKEGRRVTKVSRRDMPFVVTAKQDGATTVAATMIVAAMAGIRVFATGGIGGVHRGAAETLDISADLQELAQTDVAVICAGAKSILDLGLTLEYLETHGVPVVGYQTEILPAFYCRESEFSVNYRLDSPEQIAAAMKAKWAMDLRGGMVIANPVPETYAMPRVEIDAAIEKVLSEADQQGISGKAITPFLLARISELTGGESLESNIQLVLNNARLAAQIAVAYCRG